MRRIDLTKAQAARSSTIRDLDRQFVLNYIRDREPVSRADIARLAHHRPLARRDHPAQHTTRPALGAHRRLDPERADAHGFDQPRARAKVRPGGSLTLSLSGSSRSEKRE